MRTDTEFVADVDPRIPNVLRQSSRCLNDSHFAHLCGQCSKQERSVGFVPEADPCYTGTQNNAIDRLFRHAISHLDNSLRQSHRSYRILDADGSGLLATINHQEPDRVPLDLGGTRVTSIAVGLTIAW